VTRLRFNFPGRRHVLDVIYLVILTAIIPLFVFAYVLDKESRGSAYMTLRHGRSSLGWCSSMSSVICDNTAPPRNSLGLLTTYTSAQR
jgi:hypothetical protein